MTKRVQAKYKVNRRLGVNLWGRAKSPVNRREYAPGQHGTHRKKPTDYGIQLLAKQKLRFYYGNIGERQFHAIYEEASRRRGDTSENIIELLERRLDAVVYRMKFAATVFAARQLVGHGHILVNGKTINICSYRVHEGDTIEVIPAMKENIALLLALGSNERDIPDYMEMDPKECKGVFTRAPKLADVPYPVVMEPNLVVEFYSR
ncbi:MAG: 30S ribosomal protein S4 [Holosporales bacterium]|jgi:small subunit ribosomal protein S4|nr:30S ribosomal protein S4 [Holosporales bacterium]